MPRRSSADVSFLLIDGYNLLGTTTQLDDTVEALTEESTPLGTRWRRYDPLKLSSASLSQNGYFDDAAGSAHEALAARSGAHRIVCYGWAGNAVGQPVTGFAGALQTTYAVVASRTELTKANATYQGSGEADEAVILLPYGEVTDTLDGPVYDGGAAADGGAVYLQVSALTLGGYDGVRVIVQHSADNVVFTDLVTFNDVATAPAAARLAIPGAIQRYARARVEFIGAGSDPAVTLLVAIARY